MLIVHPAEGCGFPQGTAWFSANITLVVIISVKHTFVALKTGMK